MKTIPRRGGRHYVLVKGAEDAMEAFRMEVANDLGFGPLITADKGFKNLTTEQVGQIGGTMVRRIQAAGEFEIMKRFKNGETRLMPLEALPPNDDIREVTNTGNTNPVPLSITNTEHSGQHNTEGIPKPPQENDKVH